LFGTLAMPVQAVAVQGNKQRGDQPLLFIRLNAVLLLPDLLRA